MTNVFKKSNAAIYSDANKNTIDFQIGNSNIDCVFQTVNGTYPDNGKWAINEKCFALYYVVVGGGELIIDGFNPQKFETGDCITVPVNQKYKFNFDNAELVIACNPAWYPQQHKYID